VPGAAVGRPTAQITAEPAVVPLDEILVEKTGVLTACNRR
jgi:hypothetical protein